MSAAKRLLLISMIWSVLVVAILLVLAPEARSTPILVAIGTMLAGWLVAAGFNGESANNLPVRLTDRQIARDIVEHCGDTFVQLSSEFSTQIRQMREEVSRVQTIFGEAIGKLIASFEQMNALAQGQQQLGMQVVGSGSEGESVDDFHVFAVKTSVTLRHGIATEVEAAVNQAIVSLQFQDMVAQLLSHVSRRLEVLDELAGDAQRLALALRDTHDPAGTLRTLDSIREDVALLSQKLSALKLGVSNNPVSQTGFASGDVELF